MPRKSIDDKHKARKPRVEKIIPSVEEPIVPSQSDGSEHSSVIEIIAPTNNDNITVTAEQTCSESGTLVHDPNKFKKEHINFVSRILRQGGASHQDKEEIYRLYKLYIMPDHKGWTNSNCKSCGSAIVKLFDDLKKFVHGNENKFIN